MKKIYTAGFPRSGTWWVTRLLSDLLDSLIKTLPPDNVTVSDFCQTGKGDYTIYKTHWLPHEWDGEGKAVFIQRDPRDVAVSTMFYSGAPSLTHAIEVLAVKHSEYTEYRFYQGTGAYDTFVRAWLGYPGSVMVQYEWLHSMPYLSLARLHGFITGELLLDADIEPVIERQSFANWADKYPHAMRKGIAGDWVNHFKREHGKLITEYLGQLMLEQGYIKDLDWWKKL